MLYRLHYRTYWFDAIEWAHFGRLHSMEQHHNLGLALDLSDGSHTQLLVLDETSKAGPRVQSTNHSEDGQHWSVGHHIPFKLSRKIVKVCKSIHEYYLHMYNVRTVVCISKWYIWHFNKQADDR